MYGCVQQTVLANTNRHVVSRHYARLSVLSLVGQAIPNLGA